MENESEDTTVNSAITTRDAVTALLNGNVLEFNEIMSGLITDRAAEYVNATREILQQDGFDLNGIEEIEIEDPIEDEIEETE